MEEWEGTEKELKEVVKFCINRIKENYPNLTNKEFNKIFLEAFTRNTVQEEIKSQMNDILE